MGEKRVLNCSRNLNEQKIQIEATKVAFLNLMESYNFIKNEYTHFMNKYKEQISKEKELQDTFEDNITNLEKIELIPDLQTETRKNLLDCLYIKQIILFKAKCIEELELFKTRVLRIENIFEEITKQINENSENKIENNEDEIKKNKNILEIKNENINNSEIQQK
jgi:hypothetical protein